MQHQPPEKIVSLMSQKLAASYRWIRSSLAAEGLSGMDVSHGDVLYQLYSAGPLGMGELARRIGKDKSTATALVKKMEHEGLVKRRGDLSDARVSIVELSDKGESYRESFMRISTELMALVWKGFRDYEKETLMGLLERLGP